jgi:hypothetical protein
MSDYFEAHNKLFRKVCLRLVNAVDFAGPLGIVLA